MMKESYIFGIPVAFIKSHNEKGGLSHDDNRAIRFSSCESISGEDG